MTNERAKRIAEIENRVTQSTSANYRDLVDVAGNIMDDEDHAYVVEACRSVPWLLAELRKAEAEIDKLRGRLNEFADANQAWLKESERQQEEISSLSEIGPRPISDWVDDDGPVLCFTEPIEEPPYCGTPRDDDFPWFSTPLDEIMFVPLPRIFRHD